ncbi:extracellular solute-binding protein [Orbaceae bacterium ac157xtp]
MQKKYITQTGALFLVSSLFLSSAFCYADELLQQEEPQIELTHEESEISPIEQEEFDINDIENITFLPIWESTDQESAPNPKSETEPEKNKVYTKKAFALLGEPKYADDFTHFDYVNPNAPKGGTLRLGVVGNYDNFNRFASRGVREHNVGIINETLFIQSHDELTSYYPLLATSITYSDDFKWAEVELNPNAYFHDGVPVTAEDVEFTYQKLMTEGVPQYRIIYAGIKVEALDKQHIRFELPNSDREKLLTFIGNFTVLSKHFWQDKNLAEPLTTPPVGSGPYFVSNYKLGQFTTYQLDDNYWGQSLPVNQGRHNFKFKKIEYYMDDSVALEAFKAGEYDFREESHPKNWFTQYQGQYFDKNYIIKQQEEVTTATPTRWLAFNIERPLFNDRKVRQALTLAFDFAWLNHAFYYDSYKRPMSYFENTEYAATGLPTEQELAWLTPYRDVLPTETFGEAYSIPESDGSGFNRENLLKAKTLLEQAGWVIKDHQLINQTTGELFEFELLTYMGADNKYAIPFQQNLAKLGIKMNIVAVDYAQATRRLRERDYDMMPSRYGEFDYPTSSLMVFWGSEYLDSSWNASGLHNQVIDELINNITQKSDDKNELLYLGRALDRVLTHEYAMIPMWYPKYEYYAYWDRFEKPAIKPTYTIGLDNWWYSKEKSAQLPKASK